MKTLLEVPFEGWTATPRMPYILSGNAICLPTPTYSILLGLVGCCLGRIVNHEEVRIGFQYRFDDIAVDIETRHRLSNSKGKIKASSKGTDAYHREFHINPKLILWLDRPDWEEYFRFPIGAPALGQSQDLLKIIWKNIRIIEAEPIPSAIISGCLLPYSPQLNSPGQLVQLVEAYQENLDIGTGRTATSSRIFLSIPWMNDKEIALAKPITFPNLFHTPEKTPLYLHNWQL